MLGLQLLEFRTQGVVQLELALDDEPCLHVSPPRFQPSVTLKQRMHVIQFFEFFPTLLKIIGLARAG